ncbi:MAG TPA: hypothetical protein VGM39_17255 [Kofleriaceae bacterium]|jgi:hypothetical protein
MRAILLVLLLASPVWADSAPHKEGDYGGVEPGKPKTDEPGDARKDGKPPKAKKPPPKGTLSWIGFEAKDGGAQVFLQSIAPFEVSQKIEGTTLVVHADLNRMAANVGRIIDTRFFDNPLANIHASRAKRGKGTDIRITFKNPKDAKEASARSGTEADGYSYVYLSFGEGTPEPAKPGSDVEK